MPSSLAAAALQQQSSPIKRRLLPAKPSGTDDGSLVIRREAVVKQLLDFALKWSQTAACAERGQDAAALLSTRLTSLQQLEPAGPTAAPALKALAAARASASSAVKAASCSRTTASGSSRSLRRRGPTPRPCPIR